jgi:hypothetical protein
VWKNISKNEKLRDLILGRTTLLQVGFVLLFFWLQVDIENYKIRFSLQNKKKGGSS